MNLFSTSETVAYFSPGEVSEELILESRMDAGTFNRMKINTGHYDHIDTFLKSFV